MHFFDFVVTAPDGERRMMTEPSDIAGDFALDITQKLIVEERIRLTGKLKILPQKNTHLVAF